MYLYCLLLILALFRPSLQSSIKDAGFATSFPVGYELNNSNFDFHVKQSLKNGSIDHWIIEFYASWCGACAQFAPTFAAFDKAVSSNTRFRVGKLDVDKETLICNRFFITKLPTLYLISGKDLEVRELDRQQLEKPRDFLTWIAKDRWKSQELAYLWFFSPFGLTAQALSYMGYFGDLVNHYSGLAIKQVTGEQNPDVLARYSVLFLSGVLGLTVLIAIRIILGHAQTAVSKEKTN